MPTLRVEIELTYGIEIEKTFIKDMFVFEDDYALTRTYHNPFNMRPQQDGAKYGTLDDLPDSIQKKLAVLFCMGGAPAQDIAGVGTRIAKDTFWVDLTDSEYTTLTERNQGD